MVEVVAAVAIVAFSLVAILGLLSGLAQRAAETHDRQVAAGLAEAVTVELRRLAGLRGWDAMVAAAESNTGGVRLVAARDGSSLREWAAAEDPARDQYFLVEARRRDEGALAYRVGAPVLPLAVSVSWPYRPAVAARLTAEVPRDERHTFEFNVAVNR